MARWELRHVLLQKWKSPSVSAEALEILGEFRHLWLTSPLRAELARFDSDVDQQDISLRTDNRNLTCHFLGVNGQNTLFV